MSQPKVLFLTATLGVGGSETKIVKIANALSEFGHDVAIAYLNPPAELLDNVSPQVPVTHLMRRGKYSVASMVRLRRLIGKSPSIVFSVNFYPLLYILPALSFSPGGRHRSVCLINTTDFVDSQWIWGHFYTPFLKRCDELVYGCRFQQQYWTRKYKLPSERSSYLYNGVDSEFYSPAAVHDCGAAFRAQFGIPVDAVVIGGIGRLAPEKNFDLLIQAVGRLHTSGREAYLVLVGNGRERSALESVAAECEISDKVIWTGILADVRPALSAMEIFVLPSRAVETFSNAALEAMSMARPVVLSNIGGAAEMVNSGEDGHLFEAGDCDTLTSLLIDLFDSSVERERLGTAARENVISRFNFDSMVSGYRSLISSKAEGL